MSDSLIRNSPFDEHLNNLSKDDFDAYRSRLSGLPQASEAILQLIEDLGITIKGKLLVWDTRLLRYRLIDDPTSEQPYVISLPNLESFKKSMNLYLNKVHRSFVELSNILSMDAATLAKKLNGHMILTKEDVFRILLALLHWKAFQNPNQIAELCASSGFPDVYFLITQYLEDAASKPDSPELLLISARENTEFSSESNSNLNKGEVLNKGKRYKLHTPPPIKTTKTQETQTLHLRIVEEPLTGYNLALIISAISELHTKFWLTAQGRFEDLINYVTTNNPAIAQETALNIGRISHNSPADIELKMDVSPAGVSQAVQQVIDTVYQVNTRKEKARLENQKLLADIEEQRKKIEAEQADKDLERRIREETHLMELRQKQLEQQNQFVQSQLNLLSQALEIGNKMAEILNPNADSDTRAMAAQTYVKNILELGSAKGLETVLQLQPPKSVKPSDNDQV